MKTSKNIYKVVVEDPPARSPRRNRENTLIGLLEGVAKAYPNRWVRITKNVKHTGYIFILKKSNFPNMEITTRRNADGTSGVWVKFHT